MSDLSNDKVYIKELESRLDQASVKVEQAEAFESYIKHVSPAYWTAWQMKQEAKAEGRGR